MADSVTKIKEAIELRIKTDTEDFKHLKDFEQKLYLLARIDAYNNVLCDIEHIDK